MLGMSVTTWLILAISLVAVGLTALSLRRVIHFDSRIKLTLGESSTSEHSEPFLVNVAFYSGTIFLAVICAQTFPILLLMGID